MTNYYIFFFITNEFKCQQNYSILYTPTHRSWGDRPRKNLLEKIKNKIRKIDIFSAIYNNIKVVTTTNSKIGLQRSLQNLMLDFSKKKNLKSVKGQLRKWFWISFFYFTPLWPGAIELLRYLHLEKGLNAKRRLLFWDKAVGNVIRHSIEELRSKRVQKMFLKDSRSNTYRLSKPRKRGYYRKKSSDGEGDTAVPRTSKKTLIFLYFSVCKNFNRVFPKSSFSKRCDRLRKNDLTDLDEIECTRL